MKIKGKNILIELAKLKESVLNKNNDVQRRVNEGIIISLGEEITDEDYKPGVQVVFLPTMAEAIQDSDPLQLIINVDNILAVRS